MVWLRTIYFRTIIIEGNASGNSRTASHSPPPYNIFSLSALMVLFQRGPLQKTVCIGKLHALAMFCFMLLYGICFLFLLQRTWSIAQCKEQIIYTRNQNTGKIICDLHIILPCTLTTPAQLTQMLPHLTRNPMILFFCTVG